MKREDLFEAIGNVEAERLLRTELGIAAPSAVSGKEGQTMKTHSKSKIMRTLLVAAVLVCTLGIIACAASCLFFESPQEMLSYVFGNETGYDHVPATQWTDPEKPDSVYIAPGFERVPADEGLMQSEALPLVSSVGQSISWKGYTLTVDSNLYDRVTNCGLLTYTLENPDGLPDYKVFDTGEIFFPGGELVSINQYDYSYIIQDKTTDTKLTAVCYYQLRNPDSDSLELSFTIWASLNSEEVDRIQDELLEQVRAELSPDEALAQLRATVEQEGYDYAEKIAGLPQDELETVAYSNAATVRFNELYQCPYKISIPGSAAGEMSHVSLADGMIRVSPIAICVDVNDMPDYPNEKAYPNDFISVTKLRFRDGTEYLVRDDETANYVFAVGRTDKDVTFMFNRIIDVNELDCVILDGGLEFPVN